MKNENSKTKKELIEEIDELRRRVTQFEDSEFKRELLEKALEKSETKFRSLTERSVVGVYLIQNGFFRYVNPRLAEIFGYKPEEIIDKLPPRTLVYKEDRRRLEENLRKRIAGEVEAVNYQFRGLKKDGSVIYVQAYGSRMEYEGAPSIIGSLVDITQRKIAEKSIKDEKKRFQSLCEHVPFGVVMVGKDGDFEYKNPMFIELFGDESDCGVDSQSQNLDKIDNTPARKPLPQWKNYMKGLRKGGAQPRTFAVKCRDGNEKIVHFRPVQLLKKAYLVTCEDITKRIESEDALRKSERRYKTLVEEINDGYFVVQDQRISFANQAFCRMHGTTVENVLGRSFLSFVSPEYRRGLLEAYWGILAGRPAEKQIQYSRLGAPPENAHTEVKARAADLGEGPVLIGICRDISERVAMESKIQDHERMAYVGNLSASLSHEIRNSLSSIKLNLQILSKKLELDDYDRRRLEITTHEVSRLETILRQLLDY